MVNALTDDLDGYIAEALQRQPSDITEYEALLASFTRGAGSEGTGTTHLVSGAWRC